LRALRVSPAQQLPLLLGGDDIAEQLWWSELPEQARVEVLRLLARMIARGVLVDTDIDGDEPEGLS
jgi:hypothetical protein